MIFQSSQFSYPVTSPPGMYTTNTELVNLTNLFLVDHTLKAFLSTVWACCLALQPVSEAGVTKVLPTALSETTIPQYLHTDIALETQRHWVIHELVVVASRTTAEGLRHQSKLTALVKSSKFILAPNDTTRIPRYLHTDIAMETKRYWVINKLIVVASRTTITADKMDVDLLIGHVSSLILVK